MADQLVPISWRYLPCRKLFAIRFHFAHPAFRRTLTELLTRLKHAMLLIRLF